MIAMKMATGLSNSARPRTIGVMTSAVTPTKTNRMAGAASAVSRLSNVWTPTIARIAMLARAPT